MESSEIANGKSGKPRSLLAQVPGGYAFRHIVDYFNQLFTEANLVFDATGVSLCKMDSKKHCINDFTLYGDRLPTYFFNPGEEEEEIVFGVAIESLRGITQNFQRRQAFNFVMYPHKKKLWMPAVGGLDGVTSRERDAIPHKKINESRLDMEQLGFIPSTYNRVCNVPILRFHTMIQSFCKIKVPSDNLYAEIKVYQAGIRCRISDAAKTVVKTEYFGTIPDNVDEEDDDDDDPDSDQPNIFFVQKSLLKALSKLNNICSGGTIPVHYVAKKPLLLIWSFENIGENKIWIFSSPPS